MPPVRRWRRIASAASVETGTTGRSSASAMPCASAIARRTPVNAPGPRPTAIASSCDLRDAGFGQQLLRPRQRQFGMPARRDLEALAHLAVDPDGDGTGFGGGFEGEQFHAAMQVGCVGASTRTGCRFASNGNGNPAHFGESGTHDRVMLRCTAKNASTSATSRVRGNGGSESRNSLP